MWPGPNMIPQNELIMHGFVGVPVVIFIQWDYTADRDSKTQFCATLERGLIG